MLKDNLKIKVRVKDLIKKLEAQKSKREKSYDKKLETYNSYIKKISPKISNELREIADWVDEQSNVEKLNIGYNNKVTLELKTKLKFKPSRDDTRYIDNVLGALELSSDEFITIKQSDYNSYFC